MPRTSESLRVKEQLLLENYIKEQGLNRSRVREALLELIGEQMGIFSPETLITLAKERKINISI